MSIKKVVVTEGPGLGRFPLDMGVGTKTDEFFTMRSILVVKKGSVVIVTGCNCSQGVEKKEGDVTVIQIPWNGSKEEKMTALTATAHEYGADEKRIRVISWMTKEFDKTGNIIFVQGTDDKDVIRETLHAGVKLAKKVEYASCNTYLAWGD